MAKSLEQLRADIEFVKKEIEELQIKLKKTFRKKKKVIIHCKISMLEDTKEWLEDTLKLHWLNILKIRERIDNRGS